MMGSAISKAGRIKGGKSQTPDQRTFSRNRTIASEAGRKGGQKAQENRRRKREEQDEKS